MKLKLKSIIVLLITYPIFAFEVNTHQGLTRIAIGEYEKINYQRCISQQDINKGALNLKYFVENSFVEDERDYKSEMFEGYENTYFDYAREGMHHENWDIDFKNTGAFDLIEAGVVLEDSVYADETFSFGTGADGRFNNHFYSAQFVSSTSVGKLSERALYADGILDAFGTRTDNISWALNDNTELFSYPDLRRKNDYTITDAFKYYRQSFEGTKAERRENQAKLFVSIGSMLHMLQDLHSPAHVRNGTHATGDYLEIYGREEGGFRLLKGKFKKSKTNTKIIEAIDDADMNDMVFNSGIVSYQHFFNKEALWISQRFFSQAHGVFKKEKFCLNPFAIINSKCYWNPLVGKTKDDLFEDFHNEKTTIFDSRNIHPTRAEINITTPIPDAERYYFTGVGEDKWLYAESNILGVNKTTALLEKSPFGIERYTMMSVVNGTNKKSYNNYEKKAMEDTAINVMPRAVMFSRAFVDYFFRGRMEASFSKNNETIIIKNISDATLVSRPDLVTFKQGAKLKVYYINGAGESKEITSFTDGPPGDGITLPNDLEVGDTFIIKGVAEKLSAQNIYPEAGKKNLLILFDGEIGKDYADEYDFVKDDFNLNARGMAVAYIKKERILQTMQNTCVVKYDDGYYKKGAPLARSRDDVANTVTDHFSELMWQDQPENSTILKPWVSESVWSNGHALVGELNDVSGDTAYSYCSNLSLAGHDDWRLPTMHELLTLVRYVDGTEEPSAFKYSNTEEGLWSIIPFREYGLIDTSEFGIDSYRARFLGTNGSINSAEKRTPGRVRCVRTLAY